MLVALKNNGERIYANEIFERGDDYYCPECGERLIFRKGLKNIPHFAHTGESICHFRKGGGESPIHNFMKQSIKEIVERDNNCSLSELEWKIEDKNGRYVIADYYFEKYDNYGKKKKCAVECVYKHDDLLHFLNKNRFYLKNNVYPIWVFDLNKFLDDDNDFKEEVRVNEIMKEAHKINFGKIWGLDYDNKVIYALHFDSCYRWVEETSFTDWGSLMSEFEASGEWQEESEYQITRGGYERYLPNTKMINWKLVKKFDITSYSLKRADNFCDYDRLIASPFMKPFW